METTKILRERFEQFLTDEVDLPLGDFEFILPFIEQEIKLAEERMKQRCLECVPDNEIYNNSSAQIIKIEADAKNEVKNIIRTAINNLK